MGRGATLPLVRLPVAMIAADPPPPPALHFIIIILPSARPPLPTVTSTARSALIGTLIGLHLTNRVANRPPFLPPISENLLPTPATALTPAFPHVISVLTTGLFPLLAIPFRTTPSPGTAIIPVTSTPPLEVDLEAPTAVVILRNLVARLKVLLTTGLTIVDVSTLPPLVCGAIGVVGAVGPAGAVGAAVLGNPVGIDLLVTNILLATSPPRNRKQSSTLNLTIRYVVTS